MNKAIKILEEIAQGNSLQQYDSLSDMLKEKNISDSFVTEVKKYSSELICGVFPADDDSDDETEEQAE